MIGFIKKDLMIVKANTKVSLVVLAMLLAISLQGGNTDAIAVLPIIGLMLFLGTFSYDEMSRWNAYAATIPDGRRNVVSAKYVTSFLLCLVLTVFAGVLISVVRLVLNETVSIGDVAALAMGGFFGTSLTMAFLYPLMIKWGALNGRIALFALFMAVGCFGYLASEFLPSEPVQRGLHMINDNDVMTGVVLAGLTVVSLVVSYLVSNRIYSKKEF